MVRSIFYAICVSTWASTVAGVIQGCANLREINNVWLLLDYWENLLIPTKCKIVFCMGSLLFLTSYFYDEWKSHHASEKNSLILLGWLFFVIQCATLNCLPCSLINAALGLVVVTFGLCCSKAEKKWWLILENVVWGLSLACVWFSSVLWSIVLISAVLLSGVIHKFFRNGNNGGSSAMADSIGTENGSYAN